MNSNKFYYASSFVLKIIAIVSMTIDHIGVFTKAYYPSLTTFYTVCRYLGRFALPLFCFMIVEGVIHTKNYKKYAAKLGLLALLISIFLAVCQYVPSLKLTSVAKQGNIFIDLLLGSVMIYCLTNKNKYIKLIAILPFSISVLSFVAKMIESTSFYQVTASWYPYFLRLQYDWLSLLMMLGFYGAYIFTDMYFTNQSKFSGIQLEQVQGTQTYRTAVNLFACLAIVVANIIYYVFRYSFNGAIFWNPNIQLAAILSCLIIVSYNGKRGYDSKPFRVITYLYYPVHLAIIYGIFALISIL